MSSPVDPILQKILAKDKTYLETTQLPIVTVSASFKEDLKGWHGYLENNTTPDVVFSRAHFSMAVAIAVQVWGKQIDPAKAWIVDPTNYVSERNWRGILLTEVIGKTLARWLLLKKVKDLVDIFGRGRLPILNSIAPPLLYLSTHVKRPILSLHVAAGNILAGQGKTVVQVITDPHVRDEYLTYIDRPNFYLCVFDEKTKIDVLEKANTLDKIADPKRIFVTGPPVDPRIILAKKRKHPWRNGPLKLCITTGGIGTNKSEIRQILNQLLPQLRRRPSPYQLMLYAGTQADIKNMVRELARELGVSATVISKLPEYSHWQIPHWLARSPAPSPLTIIYHPQIVDANELLIRHAFAWADGFITKPSGDMAYDAAAAGCFILTLAEWGVWEHHVSEFFQQQGIARTADVDHIDQQLQTLTDASRFADSWVERAMNRALKINKLYLQGSQKIIEAIRNIGSTK